MVTSPTGKGVSVIGGSAEPFEFSKAMFELSQSIEWTRLEQTLKIGHWAHLAIPIPDELVYEKKNIIEFDPFLLHFSRQKRRRNI